MGQLFKVHEKKRKKKKERETPTSDCAKNMPMASGITGIN